MSREDLQRKYIELKILEQQTNQVQQQLAMLDNQLSILERTKESIYEINSVKPGSQTFIPLGQGVFVKGEVKDTKNLLVGVGANIAVSKNVKESKEIIDKQIVEVNNLMKQMEEQLQQAGMHAGILEKEIQELASKEENNLS